MLCVVGVWLVVLAASSSILYGKVPRLVAKKTNRVMQTVFFFRRQFVCGALLCNCSSAEREGLSTHQHVPRECSAEPFMRSILSLRIFASLPDSRLRFFIAIKFSTPNSTPLYSSIDKLYAQNFVFEIVHKESVKVYLHMHNGNVQ